MTNWIELTRSYSVWDDNNIKGFFGEMRFLSNFHPCIVKFDGWFYPSSEHAYMSAKTTDMELRANFHSGPNEITCKQAKKIGRSLILRKNWDNLRKQFMFVILFDKFTRNDDLREKLLETGTKYIEETNHWNDLFWGVDHLSGQGQNMLGKTLMVIREMIR